MSPRILKADKVAKLLTEQVAGQPRMRLLSPVAKLERGAMFAVLGTDGKYNTQRYLGPDEQLIERCTCPAGVKKHPTCSHMEAARLFMRIAGWTR